MVFSIIVQGIAAKFVTGIDDALANTTVFGVVARTRAGKVAFAVGVFTMLALIIGISVVIGTFVTRFAMAPYIASFLLAVLGLLVFFDVLVHEPRKLCCKYVECTITIVQRTPFHMRIINGFLAGSLSYAATGLDEIITYSALMLRPLSEQQLFAAGIFIAETLILVVMFRFAPLVLRIPYKNRIAGVGILIFAALTLMGVV